MQNRTPVPREARAALPEFAPVPRKYRHDGWTPERQQAFIEALADTGCVSRAAAMVNMAQANCYTLRRAPGAEGFRRAWDAALDFGVQRLKDVAFERAIEGQLIPVFVAGKLMGFRRKRNDALLMFCLRHYGRDAADKRTTINYISTRAGAAAASDGSGAAAQASATVRTVITGDGGDGAAGIDALAETMNGFAGVSLDATAEAAIAEALAACAARQRAADAAIEAGGDTAADALEGDMSESFIRLPLRGREWRGELLPPVALEEYVPFAENEPHWSLAGAEMPAIAEVKKPKRKPGWGKRLAGNAAAGDGSAGNGSAGDGSAGDGADSGA